MKLLAFIFGSWVFVPYSIFIRFLLKVKGVKVGRKFLIQGTPKLTIRGRASNIIIGDNVTFTGDIDLRNRENGKIIIGNKCRIDHGVRLVAAREATLTIGEETEIGLYSVLNCGADVMIGRQCMISGFVFIQSSNHGTKRGQPIKEQPHIFKPIQIGDDVWLASHSTVLAGATIGSGTIVGAKSVVTKNIPPNSIAVGIPAQITGERN
jgi:acetyltransferase-like isoleucine patch superfamily enzyme